jgi:hypothetical protein
VTTRVGMFVSDIATVSTKFRVIRFGFRLFGTEGVIEPGTPVHICSNCGCSVWSTQKKCTC